VPDSGRARPAHGWVDGWMDGWVMQGCSRAAGAELAAACCTLPPLIWGQRAGLPGGGSCHAEELSPLGCLPSWHRTDCRYLSCASTGDCNPQGYQSGSAPFISNENCILKLYRYIPTYPKKR